MHSLHRAHAGRDCAAVCADPVKPVFRRGHSSLVSWAWSGSARIGERELDRCIFEGRLNNVHFEPDFLSVYLHFCSYTAKLLATVQRDGLRSNPNSARLTSYYCGTPICSASPPAAASTSWRCSSSCRAANSCAYHTSHAATAFRNSSGCSVAISSPWLANDPLMCS